MPIWSDEYINYLAQRGEIDFSQEVPCIFYRFSIAVTQGSSEVTLPDGIIGIVRVTWKGQRVEPIEHSDDRGIDGTGGWIKPRDLYSQGKPKLYMSREYGYGKIKFHPVPYESVAADDTNVYGSDIENRVIISAYRIADPTGTDYRIPEYVRRRFLKYYINYKAFAQEGKGQDIIGSKYFKRKHDFAIKKLSDIIRKIPASIVLQFGPTGYKRSRKPPRPVLPTDGVWGF